MTTNLINKNNFTMMKTFNLNRTTMRVALIGLFISISVGNAWGSKYYTAFNVTAEGTGKGLVYTPSTVDTNTAPTSDSQYGASGGVERSSDTGSSSGKNSYYAWAKPARGYAFNGWDVSASSGVSVDDPNKAAGARITVTSNVKNETNTGTATAKWKNDPNTYTVTFGVPTKGGSYAVTYSYTTIEEGAFTTGGFSFSMNTSSSVSDGQKTSYKDDAVTVSTDAVNFGGWYDNPGCTGTAIGTSNSYDFTVTRATSIYAKFNPATMYYGKVVAQIPDAPYSMPGGGTIFVSTISGYSDSDFSSETQNVVAATANIDATPPASVNQTYYLHAKPTDKRYVFRGWYSDAECTKLIHPEATTADYTYSFTASSTNSASPTLGNVYAAFDFNLYYMQVEVAPSTPGLGMVLVRDNNTGTPAYTDYASYSEQFLYAYRDASTTNAYLYAKPKYGYKFSGWYDNAACTGTALSTENPYTYAAMGTSTDPMNPTIVPVYAKFVEDATTVNITYNKPDQTKGEYKASVLDIAEVDDEFVWTFTEVFTSVGKTANTVQAQHKTDVLRLEATPKTGHGVTSWTEGSTTKTTPSSLYETTGTAAKTVGVTFGDAKPFLVCSTTDATSGTAYATLREAIDNLGSNKKIVIVQNAYVPAGNYIIPSGVTLLVPFDEEQTLYTTKPGITKAAPSGQSAYCTLTLASGANIAVNGAISVSAHQNKGQPYGGAVTGKYGKIELKEGSSITLNSGSYLYCWGYITGNGKVDALNGSNVYEDFQIACWRGGTAASGMNNHSNKVFPLAQYYIQNIETKINFHYGSSETVYTGVTVSYVDPEASAKIIGTSDCLFQLKSGAILSRWFDASRDRQVYSLSGDATLGYVLMKISVTVDSRKYVLPLTNNMDIIVNSGTFTCDNDFAVLPGTSVIINEGAKVSLGSNCRMYVYDKSEWPEKTTGYNYPGNVAFYQIAYTDTKITTPRTYANMDDAKFDVNGTLEVNKAMYTTAGGANICSSKGTGNIVLKAAAGTETVTYQATQSSSNITYVSIPISAAKLHNGDGSYVATAGSTSGDKFIYSEGQDKWLKNPMTVTWNANDGTTKATTMAYSQDAFIGALPAAYRDGYTLEGWFTAASEGTQIAPTTKVTANVEYFAHWTPKQYKITYMDEGKNPFSGAHGENYPTKHKYGETTNLVNPTKEGFIFDGWFTISNCKETSRITSIGATSITKDITLYAKWRLCQINWLNMDGTPLCDPSSIEPGATPAYPGESNPEYTDNQGHVYNFEGWNPEIHKAEGDETYTAQYSLILEDEHNQNFDSDVSVVSALVKTDGKLTVNSGKTLTTQSLIIEASQDNSGEVFGNVVADNAYFDLILNTELRHWHAFTVPFEVDLKQHPILADGEPMPLGVQYDIVYYDGAERAAHGPIANCWKYVEDDVNWILTPGKAYMIVFGRDVNTVRFTKKDEASIVYTGTTSVAQNASETGKIADGGWNGIGNPTAYYALLNAGPKVGYVHNGGKIGEDDYVEYNIDNLKYIVGKAVYVQVDADKDVVVSHATTQGIITPKAPDSKKSNATATQYMSLKDYFKISIAGENDTQGSNVYVLPEEEKEDTYVIGHDLAKMSMSMAHAQMWVSRYDNQLGLNTTAPINQQAIFPLGIYTPVEGEYTISLAAQPDDETTVYLTKDGSAIWNLSYAPYTDTFEKGKTNSYGLRLVKKSPVVTTKIDEAIVDAQGETRKVLINNQVFIIRGNHVYSVEGKMIK